MPLLNANNLPVHPLSKAVEVVRKQLAGARGLIGPLNTHVVVGIDSVLTDAMEGRPFETKLPSISICYPVEAYQTDGNAGGMLFQEVTLQLYFLYYFGVPQSNVLPSHFTDLRDRHIRWNLEYLKDQGVKPNDTIGLPRSVFLDDAGMQYWQWPGGNRVTVDHDTPFQYLNQSVQLMPSSGFACSRVDLQMLIRNHNVFN